MKKRICSRIVLSIIAIVLSMSAHSQFQAIEDGIGPVNIAMSNFYFAGEFQDFDNQKLFYDCATGTVIPIANEGNINEFLNQYNNQIKYPAELLFCHLRGYFIANNNPQEGFYPYKLVITFCNQMEREKICSLHSLMTGVWQGQDKRKSRIDLQLDSRYGFTYEMKNRRGRTQIIKGNWMMLDANRITFNFTNPDPAFGHSATYNPQTGILFFNTPKGTFELHRVR